MIKSSPIAEVVLLLLPMFEMPVIQELVATE
jgi:hypothetical protein